MPTTQPKYAPCENPFLIKRTSLDLETGELNFAEFEKRCGSRRADKCDSCSKVWKDDAYYALLEGAKKHDGNITFITLTAQGSNFFGHSHTAQYKGLAKERCACRKFHKPNDELVGLPITKLSEKAKKFQYRKVVEFNHYAPRLLAITLQKIWRQIATERSLDEKDVKLPYARVMEWQSRGLLHVHIIVLGTVPTYIVERAVNGSPSDGKRRGILPTEHNGYRWGAQVDVAHINANDERDKAKLSGYVTKLVSYALKDVPASSKDNSELKEAYRNKLRAHTNYVIRCERTWAECCVGGKANADLKATNIARGANHFCIKHKRGHHQIGFTGNVLSMGRKWGCTLKEARLRRQNFAKGKSVVPNADKAFGFNKEKYFITHLVQRKYSYQFNKSIAKNLQARTVEVEGIRLLN